MADEFAVQASLGALTAPSAATGIALDLPLSPPRSAATARLGLCYLCVALLLRGLTLGSPALHIDEQFYLLVGDRLLHGALPYVDIWDRKPIGLFILFAAIRLLGGTGILQYQVAAMACAAATALTVNRIARAIAPPAGAWWAGVGYLLYLSAYNCFGGQAPVFYNLLVALAAWQMCRIVTEPPSPGLVARGIGVMALIGVSIQIKYTVVFEGIAFGLCLLARARADGFAPLRLAVAALAWVGVALVPTVLALATYVWLGQGAAFIYANFTSIFQRGGDGGQQWGRLVREMAALVPFWLAIFHAPRRPLPVVAGSNPAALPFLRIWAIAAVAGFLLFGTWYDHYVAPLLPPLAVLTAPALVSPSGRQRIYGRLLIGFGVIAAAYLTRYEMSRHADRTEVYRLAHLIQSHGGNGCVYLNEGDPVLYLMTHSCLVTPWIFPNHLAGMVDAGSLGVNVNQEVARIMASRPSVVMIGAKPSSKPVNWQSRAIILHALARDYTRFAVAPAGNRQFLLYRLKVPNPNLR